MTRSYIVASGLLCLLLPNVCALPLATKSQEPRNGESQAGSEKNEQPMNIKTSVGIPLPTTDKERPVEVREHADSSEMTIPVLPPPRDDEVKESWENIDDLAVDQVIMDVFRTLRERPDIVKKLIADEERKLAEKAPIVLPENIQLTKEQILDYEQSLKDFQQPSPQLQQTGKHVEKKAGHSTSFAKSVINDNEENGSDQGEDENHFENDKIDNPTSLKSYNSVASSEHGKIEKNQMVPISDLVMPIEGGLDDPMFSGVKDKKAAEQPDAIFVDNKASIDLDGSQPNNQENTLYNFKANADPFIHPLPMFRPEQLYDYEFKASDDLHQENLHTGHLDPPNAAPHSADATVNLHQDSNTDTDGSNENVVLAENSEQSKDDSGSSNMLEADLLALTEGNHQPKSPPM